MPVKRLALVLICCCLAVARPGRAQDLFDSAYYLRTNPDIAAAGIDPRQHFDQTGWRESRNPSPAFDTGYYLRTNPDVAAVGTNPLDHFLAAGWREGRNPSPLFNLRFYLRVNPDVQRADLNPVLHYMSAGWREGRSPSVFFDTTYYLQHNPDVVKADINPLAHFVEIGWREGRNPIALFDLAYYTATYPDAVAAGTNPEYQFIETGWRLGRNPSLLFDTNEYLRRYPDIAANGLNPLEHYLTFGQYEGRVAPPTRAYYQQDAEYQFTANLERIGASAAYLQGYTGKGILVGVLDTGIDVEHPEFAGRIQPGGRDFYFGTDNPEDNHTHGTIVSGIIAANRDGTRMQGLAYEAKILPLAIFGPNAVSAPADRVAAAFDYAVAQGVRVINASFGNAQRPPFELNGTLLPEMDAVVRATNAGVLVVFAAGNAGDPNPGFMAAMPFVKPANDNAGLYTKPATQLDYSSTQSRVLAVVSVDANNVISGFSNRCGVAAAWCLAAPGEGVVSTYNNGGYVRSGGTSYAAPFVTGAAAILMQAFPKLSADQVAAILLRTATPLGPSSIYGAGLLNLEKALQPIGTVVVATGAGAAGPAVPLARTQLQLGPAFGDAGTASFANSVVLGFDEYQRPYDFSLAAHAGPTLRPRWATSNRLAMRPQSQELSLQAGSMPMRLQAGWSEPAPHRDPRRDWAGGGSPLGRLALTLGDGEQGELSMGVAPSAGDLFRADGAGALRNRDGLVDAEVLENPYWSLLGRGTGMEMALGRWHGLQFRTRSFLARGGQDERRAFGAAAEASLVLDGLQLGAETGWVGEAGALLGGRGTGAFALDRTATTSFAGVHGDARLSGHLSLSFHWYAGRTTLPAAAGAFLIADGTVKSQGAAVALAGRSLLQADDELALTASRPLRVSGGGAWLDLPISTDADGNVERQRQRIGLSPSGRETDLQLSYRRWLGADTELTTAAIARLQPHHVRDAGTEFAALARLVRRF